MGSLVTPLSLTAIVLLALSGELAGQVICPPDGITELEKSCGQDIECICGGCWPPLYNVADCGEKWCGAAFASGGTRDTDWFSIELTDPDGSGLGAISAMLISEFPGVCFIVDGMGNCQPVIVGTIGCADDSQNLQVASAELPAPNEYFVFVSFGDCAGDGIYEGYPCGTENYYLLLIDCALPCPADLDGNGVVEAADLAELLGNWGPNPDHPADLDGDGVVGPADLAQLLGDWGPC